MPLASAYAAKPPLQAGPGVDLVASGDYESNGVPVLSAINGGTITTNGPVNVLNTNIDTGVGISTRGAGSRIDFLGGTITARNGVEARDGSHININNASIVASTPSSSALTNDTSGIRVFDNGSQVSIANSDITVSSARGSAVGINASAGTRVDITDTAIHASKTAGNGVTWGIAAADATIVMNGGSITSDNRSDYAGGGLGGFGVRAVINSYVELNGVDIVTVGEKVRGVIAGSGSVVVLNDSQIRTTSDNADGIFTSGGARVQISGSSIQTQGTSSHGLLLDAPSTAVLQGSTVSVSGTSSAGVQVNDGASVTLRDSTVEASGAGGSALSMGGVTGGSATVQVSNSILSSANGAAIRISGLNQQVAAIDLLNGTQVSSGVGVLLEANVGTQTSLTMNGDVRADGDIVIHGDAIVNVSLANQSRWTGATSNLRRLTLDTSGKWQITGSSDVRDLSNAGTVGFVAPAAGDYKSLTVRGDYIGNNGVVTVNTVLNEGGALANQHTDRLLVEGNAIGTTLIEVRPTGQGGLTDANKNGVVDADEGISLVQVGGDSRADAFALKGGYVAAGPWQYTLHAFGPGQADSSQSVLPGGKLSWDYRLGNTYVCGGRCDPGEPGDPGEIDKPEEPGGIEKPEEPGGIEKPELPHPGRIAVVPQIPSYLVAPTALFNYGSRTLDTLHQRLGELRSTAGKSNDQLGGEVFARVLGGQLKYRSDLSFNDYGYDFEQQMNTLQAGGSLVKWNAGDSTMRAGWAIDLGTTRVTPQAADGESHANYTAYGVSGWLTWQQANGFYVDAVLGAQRFSGDVSTTLRGSNVAKIHADMWTASLEVGYPFAVGKGWSVEPQAQVTRQWLNFKDFNDVDGLTTHIASAAQTTGRLGVRVAKTDEPKFAPYLRADLIRSIGDRPQVTVASEAWNVSETFSGGRIGASYRIGAGASSQFANNVSLYGEATYQHGMGSAGLRGWAANAGVRWNF
ncbi:autotransporter outer membrane beta-barrel domain-containing protein [Collimonas sp. OK412]|uniref:autotransporter family protein n=1 Tax=Collimonas sp. (strain OK412) TaxID=1801619 RepID=UPI001587BEAC|nr:autotransporter outer membrane beta-barrel domain-containing protein [Collimonas sp. OK412]